MNGAQKVERDVARQAGARPVLSVEDQEMEGAVDVQAARLSDRLTDGAVWRHVEVKRLGGQLQAGALAHRSSCSAVSAVKVMKRRMAASSAGSGWPVHSSMKNFLNSRAMAQARNG